MATVGIKPGTLGVFIKRSIKQHADAVHRGVVKGARRGAAYLGSKDSGVPVFDGVLKNAWDVQEGPAGSGQAKVVNSAPYAGVVERGARPHKMGRAGIEAIREWVRRKLVLVQGSGGKGGGMRAVHGVAPKDAGHDGHFGWLIDEITWAIVKKIEHEGQKGTFYVKNSLPDLNRFVNEAVEAELAKVIGRQGGP